MRTITRNRAARRYGVPGLIAVVAALLAAVLASLLGVWGAGQGSRAAGPVRAHRLASTVRVLAGQPPSVIIQFPLVPSGVKKAFPQATGVVTIVEGNPEVSLFDTVTVDVQHMPPDATFTIFFIELANKPFGHAEYAADLHTRDDGTGDVSFQAITRVAFAMDARTPGTSKDQSGDASGIQLEHLGMWFSSLDEAKKVLNDSTLTGTPFDGGAPPLHAGPQALTDGQADPVF
jgi:hypothetical protein